MLGELLFSLLFLTADRSNYNAFGSRLKQAIQECSDYLLRIVLEFNEPEPHFAAWPWEYRFWPERYAEGVCKFFLAQRAELLLARYVMLVDARGGRHVTGAGRDGRLPVLDVLAGEAIRPPVLGHHDSIRSLRYSPDGHDFTETEWAAQVGTRPTQETCP